MNRSMAERDGCRWDAGLRSDDNGTFHRRRIVDCTVSHLLGGVCKSRPCRRLPPFPFVPLPPQHSKVPRTHTKMAERPLGFVITY